MKHAIAILAIVSAMSSIGFAHGNEKHVVGTVTSISDNSMSVETTSRKTVMVGLSDTARFVKSGSPATLKDLKVGDRVVIHATGPEDKLVASEVRFGSTPPDGNSGMKGMDHTHP